MKIHFQDSEVSLEEGESVLEGLLRSGYDIPNGCRSGVCQSCVMQCGSDNIPQKAQTGLKESQKELGHFLACSCVPKDNMEIDLVDAEAVKAQTKVLEKQMLNDSVLRLRLEKPFDYRAGQFCTLWKAVGKAEPEGKEETVARCYSLASVASEEDFLEFHIKRIEQGIFSQWACDELSVADTISIQQPLGDCFYTASDSNQPLFLAGIGTGLAPLYGIVRDAIAKGHSGEINLVVASKQSDNFYYIDELTELKKQHEQLNIHLVSQEVNKQLDALPLIEGDVYEYIREAFPSFKGSRIFLCGANSFVQKMKKNCFMSGANMPDISADAFLAFGDK